MNDPGGTRTRAIERKLREIEQLPGEESQKLLGELKEPENERSDKFYLLRNEKEYAMSANLYGLNRQLRSLIRHTGHFTALDKSREEFLGLFRKSYIASILSDRFVIAVAGLQGVGKTSLIQSFYGLLGEDFQMGIGRCETIPVLITETSNNEKGYYVYQFNDGQPDNPVQKKRIERDDFLNKCKKYNKDEVLLEAEVPQKLFFDNQRHFLLLPGFQSEDDYLKELTYNAIRSATTSLIVFDGPSYATKRNRDLVEGLINEFRDNQPLVIVTHVDTKDDIINSEKIVEQILTDFKINHQEKDRIHLTSTRRTDWQNGLAEGINKYAFQKDNLVSIRERNLKQLTKQIRDCLSNLSAQLNALNVDLSVKEYQQVKRIARVFDEVVDSLRSDYKGLLEVKYSEYFKPVKDYFDNLVANRSLWPDFPNPIPNPIKRKIELENYIRSSFKDGAPMPLVSKHLHILNGLQNGRAHQFNLGLGLLPTDWTEKNITLLIGNNDGAIRQTGIQQKTLDDVCLLFKAYKVPGESFSDQLENSVKWVPIFALESMRLTLLTAAEIKHIPDYTPIAIGRNEVNDLFSNNKREIALGIGILFGLDVMGNGDLDLFGLLQQNATAGAGTAVAAGGIDPWVGGTLVVAAALIYAINKVINEKIDMYKAGHIAFGEMQKYVVDRYLNLFDTYMKSVREVMVERLRYRYGIAQEYAYIQNIYESMEGVKRIVHEIEQGYR